MNIQSSPVVLPSPKAIFYTFLVLATLSIYSCKKDEPTPVEEPKQSEVTPDEIETYHITLNTDLDRVAMEHTKDGKTDRFQYFKGKDEQFTWNLSNDSDTIMSSYLLNAQGEHQQLKDTLSCDSTGCLIEEAWMNYDNGRILSYSHGTYLYTPQGERKNASPETISTYEYEGDQLLRITKTKDQTNPIVYGFTYSDLTAKFNTNILFEGQSPNLVKSNYFEGGGSRHAITKEYSYRMNTQGYVTHVYITTEQKSTGTRSITRCDLSYTFK
ncbi:hypothetical protein KFE98_09370 [bacterium SCSIO 12741]|nr:hypothetical protein KFE98_09370 [bacterium SCSIO 12741]